MATQLDLQEQEQLDALKAFWKQYGNLVTWVLVVALAAFAGWNGWNKWQADKGYAASAMYDTLEVAATAGDAERAGRIFDDLKSRYPGTAFAEQGALVAAKAQVDKGQLDAAKATLAWAADNAVEDEMRTVARLRLAGVLIEQKQFDEALKQLDAAKSPAFETLVADRRGDALFAAGRKDEARAAWQAAWKSMDEKSELRRLLEAKLASVGAAPAPAASASGSAS